VFLNRIVEAKEEELPRTPPRRGEKWGNAVSARRMSRKLSGDEVETG